MAKLWNERMLSDFDPLHWLDFGTSFKVRTMRDFGLVSFIEVLVAFLNFMLGF